VSRLQSKLEGMGLFFMGRENMLPSDHQDIAICWVSGMGIGNACTG